MILALILVLTFITGFLFGIYIRNRMEGTAIFDYFAVPSAGYKAQMFELNWSGRQFFYLFSKGMGERWYEARAHTYRGVFISILSAFHLVHIVRIEYETSRDSYMSSVTFITHGFQSLATLQSKMPVWIEEKKSQAKDAQYWYQTFIAGHNVVGDCMNGNFS